LRFIGSAVVEAAGRFKGTFVVVQLKKVASAIGVLPLGANTTVVGAPIPFVPVIDNVVDGKMVPTSVE
jgi:hypothetical protein